ncbi:MAG: septal ring lytic transglycosylase RlpA family protein [Gammaproteobacteria bacterium]|nr:septal ring lytic transglycosylase RlpA family protein [Gammaproteobacteria bacterium]
MNIRPLTLLFAVSVLLSACGTVPDRASGPRGGVIPTPDKDGAPPRGAVDIASIPDVVPREEPRSKFGNPQVYTVAGISYRTMASSEGHVERGLASWYGTKFHGRRTSSGEPYDLYSMTAAHKTLPLPTYVEVTNLKNGRKLVVKVNDRGPFHQGRIIDLSYAAAQKLGINSTGPVEIRAITPGSPPSAQMATQLSSEPPPTDARETKLYLQVGAFVERGKAEQLRSRLQEHASSNIQISPSKKAQSTIYRVRIGPLASVEETDQMAARLSELGIRESQIVSD